MGDFKLSDITPERVRSAVVAPKLMRIFFAKMAAQHGDESGPTDTVLAAFLAFVEFKGVKPGKKGPSLTLKQHCILSSVEKRGHALAELVRSGSLSHWAKEKSEHVMLHPALIDASAATRLSGTDEEFKFELSEFLQNALANAEPNVPI